VATDIEPEAGMKKTRTIKVGERIAVSHNGRGAFEGIVTENNPASALIYVEGHPYERHEVLGRHDHRRISSCPEHAPTSAQYALQMSN
jgi:hypothetical protein